MTHQNSNQKKKKTSALYLSGCLLFLPIAYLMSLGLAIKSLVSKKKNKSRVIIIANIQSISKMHRMESNLLVLHIWRDLEEHMVHY